MARKQQPKAAEVNHAEQNAQGWVTSIRELVAALESEEFPVTIEGAEYNDADAVRERIMESPLSVQVRSGWGDPGAKMEAEDFEILLSTGGPALRIMGELDEHKQPRRAWLEYQDWGTPWTHHYVAGFTETLLTFCQQFYFGE